MSRASFLLILPYISFFFPSIHFGDFLGFLISLIFSNSEGMGIRYLIKFILHCLHFEPSKYKELLSTFTSVKYYSVISLIICSHHFLFSLSETSLSGYFFMLLDWFASHLYSIFYLCFFTSTF